MNTEQPKMSAEDIRIREKIAAREKHNDAALLKLYQNAGEDEGDGFRSPRLTVSKPKFRQDPLHKFNGIEGEGTDITHKLNKRGGK